MSTAATFGWLCVETLFKCTFYCFVSAATFGWLCVETQVRYIRQQKTTAATFGWLCVETSITPVLNLDIDAATFGWLCVETSSKILNGNLTAQPPSGGCVLKHHLIICAVVSEKQPPSGGCVLKRFGVVLVKRLYLAATFGWLCVETL